MTTEEINTENMFYWATRNSDNANIIPLNFEEWKKDPVLFSSLLNKKLGSDFNNLEDIEEYIIMIHKDTKSFENGEDDYFYLNNYSLKTLFNFLEKCAEEEIVFESNGDMVRACEDFIKQIQKHALVLFRFEQLHRATEDLSEKGLSCVLKALYRTVQKNIKEEQYMAISLDSLENLNPLDALDTLDTLYRT